MPRCASFLAACVALASLALASASEITAVAGPSEVCKAKCAVSFSACGSGCSEEITPDMQFFTVCQTECERTRQYCTAGC